MAVDRYPEFAGEKVAVCEGVNYETFLKEQ
jgi:hypothetical protein